MKKTKVEPAAESVLYVDHSEVERTQQQVKREVVALNAILASWPATLPKPDTVGELIGLLGEHIPGLAVKRYKLLKNPAFMALGLSLEASARNTDLTGPEQKLSDTIARYKDWNFRQQEHYNYVSSNLGLIVEEEPALLSNLQDKFTVLAKSEIVLKLKKGLETIADTINRAGIPSAGSNPYANILDLLYFEAVDGSIVATPLFNRLNYYC